MRKRAVERIYVTYTYTWFEKHIYPQKGTENFVQKLLNCLHIKCRRYK